jgi:hypothetical protein
VVKKLFLYCFRWQLSTPILYFVILICGPGIIGTILANLVGALIFFWVDAWLFKSRNFAEWEVKRLGVCHDCGKVGSVRRLSYHKSSDSVYDRRDDPDPQYRCHFCSAEKYSSLNLPKE